MISVQSKWKLILWKLVANYRIITRIILAAYCIIVVRFLEVDAWERILFLVPLSRIIIATTIKLFILREYHNIQMLGHFIFNFNQELRKSPGVIIVRNR